MTGFKFGLIVSIGFLFLIKLPFIYLSKWLDENIVILIKLIIVGITILVLSFWIRKKFVNIKVWGFHKESIKHYPFLLLPILFPGFIGLSNIQDPSKVSYLLIISIFVKAMCEEIVFRGLIFGKMMLMKPDKLSQNVLISSLLFAFLHFSNLPGNNLMDIGSQAIYAFYMGILFAILMIKTKNVWLIGAVHAVVNYLLSSKIDSNEAIVEPVVNHLFTDYIIQFTKIAILFSPILVMYYFLQRKVKLPINME